MFTTLARHEFRYALGEVRRLPQGGRVWNGWWWVKPAEINDDHRQSLLEATDNAIAKVVGFRDVGRELTWRERSWPFRNTWRARINRS